MTRMKHYHLGCGEPLKSNCTELLMTLKTAQIGRSKSRLSELPKVKPVKRH